MVDTLVFTKLTIFEKLNFKLSIISATFFFIQEINHLPFE